MCPLLGLAPWTGTPQALSDLLVFGKRTSITQPWMLYLLSQRESLYSPEEREILPLCFLSRVLVGFNAATMKINSIFRKEMPLRHSTLTVIYRGTHFQGSQLFR